MKIVLKDFFIENEETYYVLLIEHKMLEWQIKKRFSQFYGLYLELHRLYPELSIPKLDKQFLGFNQDKRNLQLNNFIDFLSKNFVLSATNHFQKFILCDIFLEHIEDFLSITKHKQKEYVKNFLSDTKITNYKNYITSLENQMLEVIEHKKTIINQLNINATRLNQLDIENGDLRLKNSSTVAENMELRKIYENNKSTIRDLTESIELVHTELDSNLNQIKDLECMNKQFRLKIDRLEEEIKNIHNKNIQLEKSNSLLQNEIINYKLYIPSAPPMPMDYSSSNSSHYSDNLSRPPSLK